MTEAELKLEIAIILYKRRKSVAAFVKALYRCFHIYATARSIDLLKDVVAVDPERIVPLELDVTNPDQIALVAQLYCATGTLVVGVFPGPVDTAILEDVPLDKVPQQNC